jgi:RHS repeat-associated protein
VRPAWGGGGGGGGGTPPTPTYPACFIHSDHLGSSTMLTCYLVTGCMNGAAARYYRYDAYGQPRAYDASGALLSSLGAALLNGYIPERLYTGQRWDWQAQLYDYGARFYDPRVANFLTEDPARHGVSAYAAWNPVMFTDPTGMFNLSTLNMILALGWFDMAAHYYNMTGGAAQEGSLAGFLGGAASSGGSAGHGTASTAGALAKGLQAVAAAAGKAAVAALATVQGGNSTAAYPVLNQSVPGGAPLSQSGLPPGTAVIAGAGGREGFAPVPGLSPSGAAVPATGAAVAGTPGYVDINVTAGYGVGATFGIQLAENGYFVYAGGALTSPPGSLSVTTSPFAASSGFAVGVQYTNAYLVSGQFGYQFGSGAFIEGGIGGPPGFSLTGFYVVGPFPYR